MPICEHGSLTTKPNSLLLTPLSSTAISPSRSFAMFLRTASRTTHVLFFDTRFRLADLRFTSSLNCRQAMPASSCRPCTGRCVCPRRGVLSSSALAETTFLCELFFCFGLYFVFFFKTGVFLKENQLINSSEKWKYWSRPCSTRLSLSICARAPTALRPSSVCALCLRMGRHPGRACSRSERILSLTNKGVLL